MANKTIYAYSSNSITCVYDITATRNGNNVIITASGTIYGNGSSSDSSHNLYAHVCHDVSPSNSNGGTTTYVSSYGTKFGTGVKVVSAPLNSSSIPTTGRSFTASWTIENIDAVTYSNVALFLSKSASSPYDSSGNAYAFIGKKSSTISGNHARYYTQSLSIPAATYIVTYDKGSNGTGTNTTDTKTYNVPLTLKGAIFTRTGYIQIGWSTTDGGSKDYDLLGSYTNNENITLYPVWEQGSPSYSEGVYVNVNGSWMYGEPYVKFNGTWVRGYPYVKVNGRWVPAYPVTYQPFEPSGSDGLEDSNGDIFYVMEV